jgi:Tfp pilus assembly protein PilF
MRKRAERTAKRPKTRETTPPSPWPAALLVAAITAAAFWPALDNQFVNWDDDKNFLHNPHFRGLDPAALRWMFTTFHLGHYHPLTWLSLGLDYTIWGLNPTGYHFTSVILHAANAVLFYFVGLRLLGGGRFAAALAGLLFALHPLRVESVAWASERRDVLSGFFYLFSALAYLRAHREGAQQERFRTRWLAVSLAAFAAALLSKVIVVSLPVVLLLLDFYPLRRGFEWREKIPYLLLAAAAAVAALARQAAGISGFAAHAALLPSLRLGLSLYALVFYIWKTALPFGLYPQYALPPSLSRSGPLLLLGAGAAVLALAAAAAALRRRFPALPLICACYAVSLLPVLSIFRVDPQQSVADHHTYLATLGFALLAAAGLAALPPRRKTAASVVVLAALFALTHRQIPVWKDSVSLWTRALAGAPDSAVAHNNLGEALAAQGRLDEAVPHFARAVQITPGYAQAHYNLGRARQKLGDLDGAVRELEQAVRIEPSFAMAHDDLANCYAALGRTAAALEHYQLALRSRPDFADAHYNLGSLLQSERRFDEAIAQYEQALRIQPMLAEAHNNWGVALDALGRPGQAVEHYRQALVLDPRNADAHNNLGLSLESQGKRNEAMLQYQEAVRLNPGHRSAAASLARLRLAAQQKFQAEHMARR